ncbi:hypothetical protein E6C60_0964 [Paenibacillus algicola]|uniref:Tox-MPTase4 domain-containing protein n=1 Tax=Paenibacillus algicola TaxID=2565926 RepID=A0A4P8XGS5_9BACL|nr:hypothetical protein [Paenibacillus algicola]QCT01682.1 hypothetical protein E6C60_0964 [Paenibacillus algicola]
MAYNATIGTVEEVIDTTVWGTKMAFDVEDTREKFEDSVNAAEGTSQFIGQQGAMIAGGLALRRVGVKNSPKSHTSSSDYNKIKDTKDARLNTYGDALRQKLGPAQDSHIDEYKSILKHAEESGVKVDFRKGTLAYEPSFNNPGRLILDPEASIGAVRHEYRHMLDDFDLGHPGMRVIADSELFWRLEYRGYMEEIRLASEIREYDAGRIILKEMRARRQEILGR